MSYVYVLYVWYEPSYWTTGQQLFVWIIGLMWEAQLLDKGAWVVYMWCMYDKSPVTGQRSNSSMYELYVWYKEPSYWTREYQLCVCAICVMWGQLLSQGTIGLMWGAQLLDKGVWVVCMWCMYDVSLVTGPRSNNSMYELYVWFKETSYSIREYQLCVCAICVMWAQLLGQGLIVLCTNYMFDVRSPVTR